MVGLDRNAWRSPRIGTLEDHRLYAKEKEVESGVGLKGKARRIVIAISWELEEVRTGSCRIHGRFPSMCAGSSGGWQDQSRREMKERDENRALPINRTDSLE